MKEMKIEYLKIAEIKPYKNNPRFNDEAVDEVAASIREFGFKVPIVIDKDNVIVTGHTRLKASKKLGLKKIPCIRADDLSEDQIRAFRLADNKVSELATWDLGKLEIELDNIDIDMTAFGFDIDEIEDTEPLVIDEPEVDYAQKTQELVENILNLGKGQFAGEGMYDIPKIRPVYELPPIREWIRFKDVLSDDDPEGKAVHFFIDDYQFERIWNAPERYLEKLKQYVCVASPDFSPYGDMPLACQIFNHYRKHWVGRWLQEHGVTVIPTIRSSTDRRSFEWFLDGEPKNGIVIVSEMWAEKNPELNELEWKMMTERLTPNKIFVYGSPKHCTWVKETDNVEYIQSFARAFFDREKKE